MILAPRPRSDHRTARTATVSRRRRSRPSGRSGTRWPRCPPSGPAASTCWSATNSWCPARASSWPPSASRQCCTATRWRHDDHLHLPRAHRLPDRGDDRDAVSSRPGTPGRRRFRLHRPADRGTAQAEGVGVHQRTVRQDRRAATGPGAGVFRPAGGSRLGAGAAWSGGGRIQPAKRRRDPADDPDARGPGRLSDSGRSACAIVCRPIWIASAAPPRASPAG